MITDSMITKQEVDHATCTKNPPSWQATIPLPPALVG